MTKALTEFYFNPQAISLESLIEIEVQPEDSDDLEVYADDDIAGYRKERKVEWSILQASTTEIMIQVNFTDPVIISKDFREVFDVNLDMSGFEPTFKSNFKVDIPEQKSVKKNTKDSSSLVSVNSVE